MKWLKYLLLLTLLYAFPAHAIQVTIIGGESAVDYSDIKLWWRNEVLDFSADNAFDNGGTNYSVGDDIASAGSAADINVGAVKNGTNGGDYPGSSDTHYFTVAAEDIVTPDQGCIGRWIKVNSWVNTTYVIIVRDSSDAFNDCWYIELTGDDELRIRWVSIAGVDIDITSAAANIDANWHYYEFCWDRDANPANTFWLEVDDAIVVSSTTNMGDITDIDEVRVGVITNDASDIHQDSLAISDDPARDFFLLKDIDNYPG